MEAKTDYFAYYSKGLNGVTLKTPSCSALEKLYCEHDESCKFYKERKAYLAELIRIHGTTDMVKIKRKYAERKGIVSDA